MTCDERSLGAKKKNNFLPLVHLAVLSKCSQKNNKSFISPTLWLIPAFLWLLGAWRQRKGTPNKKKEIADDYSTH